MLLFCTLLQSPTGAATVVCPTAVSKPFCLCVTVVCSCYRDLQLVVLLHKISRFNLVVSGTLFKRLPDFWRNEGGKLRNDVHGTSRKTLHFLVFNAFMNDKPTNKICYAYFLTFRLDTFATIAHRANSVAGLDFTMSVSVDW